MPSVELEAMRRAYVAYGRRDIGGIQALADEECEIHTVVEGRAEPQPFRGRDGIREWIENENAVWESVVIDDLELRDLGNGRVYTAAVAHVRGRSSGLELSMPVWSVAEFRDGLLIRFRSYPEETQALHAAGLDQ